MTIEIEEYVNRATMKAAKIIRSNNGWTPLHEDFINNKESNGYRVTYVNGLDDPNNSQKAIQERLDFQRLEGLREKVKRRTISQVELLELLEKIV